MGSSDNRDDQLRSPVLHIRLPGSFRIRHESSRELTVEFSGKWRFDWSQRCLFADLVGIIAIEGLVEDAQIGGEIEVPLVGKSRLDLKFVGRDGCKYAIQTKLSVTDLLKQRVYELKGRLSRGEHNLGRVKLEVRGGEIKQSLRDYLDDLNPQDRVRRLVRRRLGI